MQRTADFHDPIANAGLPQAAGVVDDAAALDTAVDMLDAHPAARDATIRGFLRAREAPTPRLPGRHDDVDMVQRERQETKILQQPAARRQGIRCGIGNPLIVGAAGLRVTQKEDGQRRIDQQDVFHGVALFLAAITARLLNRILGALDAPFSPVVSKRGEAGAGVGGCSGGTKSAVASAAAIPTRLASSFNDRVGASPSVRSVVCSTTKRPWIH
jgi:hypothetical protein